MPFDPDGRLAVDLPCVGCGYNLRTLQVDAACPECGASVATTLRPHDVTRAAVGGVLVLCGLAGMPMIFLPGAPILGAVTIGMGLLFVLLGRRVAPGRPSRWARVGLACWLVAAGDSAVIWIMIENWPVTDQTLVIILGLLGLLAASACSAWIGGFIAVRGITQRYKYRWLSRLATALAWVGLLCGGMVSIVMGAVIAQYGLYYDDPATPWWIAWVALHGEAPLIVAASTWWTTSLVFYAWAITVLLRIRRIGVRPRNLRE